MISYESAKCWSFPSTPALADVAGTASVIDGDTIEVHAQRIRLHGIDAPESRQLYRLVETDPVTRYVVSG